jgi:hypothetical protein
MELAPHGSLKDWMDEHGCLDAATAIDCGLQVCV